MTAPRTVLLMMTAAAAAAVLLPGQLVHAEDDSLEAASVKNCYTCVGNADDRTCEVAPEKVTTGAAYLPCKRKYCTIVRQEYTDHPGVVVQISRGCENTLPYNGKEVTTEFTMYYWTCSTDLCNTGDGTKPPSGGGGGGGDGLPYVLVEGMAGAAATGATLTLTGLLLLLLLQLQ